MVSIDVAGIFEKCFIGAVVHGGALGIIGCDDVRRAMVQRESHLVDWLHEKCYGGHSCFFYLSQHHCLDTDDWLWLLICNMKSL
ncbi:uncharacterized protein LOC131226675 isoform X2 [Magnolia sinica]|uniref:uncharacterized protein LOC131226675 isoform X2 n=1 Tax=Magnolia sinica TaxID=86752 RepID=UPI00265A690C|nr:uncharacterized protein LOC131226675 isoform X2 [Magnolia sinica]